MPGDRRQIGSGAAHPGGRPTLRALQSARAAKAEAAPTAASLAHAQLYSQELGIDLSFSDRELFKWFLASMLFGARVTPRIAKQGYSALKPNRLLTPRQIIKAGERRIYAVLLQAGYVRAAKEKSTRIVRACEKLCASYQGSLQKLHDAVESPRQLETLLTRLPGVGPVTANIFLRELRPFWEKADPSPLPRVVAHANERGFDLDSIPRKSLTFARVEAGLARELAKPGETRKFGRKAKT